MFLRNVTELQVTELFILTAVRTSNKAKGIGDVRTRDLLSTKQYRAEVYTPITELGCKANVDT
jgi:hypothetical protein